MATNKEKLIAAAQKLVEKGQFDKAIKEYLKVVAEEPNDVRIWLKIGDLYAKLTKNKEAADTYQRVATHYSDHGHYLKAVAVYKQILRIEPRAVEINHKLAAMYKQLGLLADAMEQYEAVATYYQREGRPKDALSALKEIVELDPENVASRIKLAELYSKEGMVPAAIEEFQRAAEFLHEHDRYDDYLKVAERLLFHAPDNRNVSREVARLYIGRGDARRALPKLQVCLKADGRDVDALALLATAFEELGQNEKTVSVLKELARVHAENGDQLRSNETMARVLDFAPDDEEARAAVAPQRVRHPTPVVHEMPQREPSVEVVLDALEEVIVGEGEVVGDAEDLIEEVEAAPAGIGAAFLEEEADEASVDGAAREEAIAKVLGETDVYLKYGLHAKALEHLQKVFSHSPDHLEAREKLKTIYVATGRVDEAMEELFDLARQSGRVRGEKYLREILDLQPENERARGLLGAGTATPQALARIQTVPARTVIDAPAPRLDQRAPSEANLDLDYPVSAEEAAPEDPYADAIAEALAADAASPEGPAVEPDVAEVEPDAADLVSVAPDTQDGADLIVEPVEQFGEDATVDGRTIYELNASHLAGVGLPPPAEALADPAAPLDPVDAEAGAPKPGGGFEDDLDEADFFIQQHLFDEARAILDGLLARYPGHPLVEAKARDLAALEQAGEPPAEAYPAPPAVGEDSDAPTFDAAFRETPITAATPAPEVAPPTTESTTGQRNAEGSGRRGVKLERGVSPEDFDTHYDLGIAYKEMGLLDEAIGEFNVVMQDPAREVQCHLMLGLCFGEKGQMTDAIGHFKRGLYAERIVDAEQLALYYELGAAYERLSDVREALYYYEKVLKRDANFRDVGRRIQALRSGRADDERGPGFDDLLSTGEARVK